MPRHKPPPTSPPQRLQKRLADAGLGSRRKMEQLISDGKITLNDKLATLGVRVTASDEVRIDGRRINLPATGGIPQVLLYHKPEGEIVSQKDPQGRASVFDKLPRIRHTKWIAVGRLDINSSGLLLFTNHGELANRLMHPRFDVEREYAVRVWGELTPQQMQMLVAGLNLSDGPAKLESIIAQGGEGANRWYHVVIKEGRNREVRRLFEALSLTVSRLMRVRFGPIQLPSRVKRGQMLKLEPKVVLALLDWAGLPRPTTPIKQRSRHEAERAHSIFTPKIHQPIQNKRTQSKIKHRVRGNEK
ncbi:MAG: pseudouridine synthase [Methylophilaceae bacterium]|nr:pseudouridine synthase [Methylophilaceae bacterium]